MLPTDKVGDVVFRWVMRGPGLISFILSSLVIAWTSNVFGQDWQQSENIWEHNGSVVFLEWKASSRSFYYLTPRAGVAGEGVRRGTLLFTGTRSGYNYVGTAYVFSARCGRIPYSVRGSISSDLQSIQLVGRAPRLDALCNAISYFDDTLTFSAVQTPYCGCNCPGEIPIADYDEWIHGATVGYSCPYLYAWSDSEKVWRSYGKVLHIAEGPKREALEEVKLAEFSTRFRLAEEEPENSYIDHVQLRLETPDGAIITLNPDMWKLSRRDHIYANVQAYKSIEFRFKLPEWLTPTSVRHATIIIAGYYERALPAACFRTHAIGGSSRKD
jgi:hypothetical protein